MTDPNALYEQLGNELLRQQLVALIDDTSPAGKARRRKATLLGIDCRKCGKVLMEVVATRPLWVVRHRERVNQERRETPGLYDKPAGMSESDWGREVYRRRREAGVTKPSGRGPWKFFPIPRQPDADAPRQLVVSVCDCGPWDTTMGWVYGQLAAAQGHPVRVGVR